MEMIFNKEKALRRTMGDEQLLAELLEFSLEDLDTQIEQIRDALDSSDWERVRERSHKLKGTAGAVGADQLFQKAFCLEQSALEGKSEQLDQLLTDLCSSKDSLLADKEIVELRGAPQRP